MPERDAAEHLRTSVTSLPAVNEDGSGDEACDSNEPPAVQSQLAPAFAPLSEPSSFGAGLRRISFGTDSMIETGSEVSHRAAYMHIQ